MKIPSRTYIAVILAWAGGVVVLSAKATLDQDPVTGVATALVGIAPIVVDVERRQSK